MWFVRLVLWMDGWMDGWLCHRTWWKLDSSKREAYPVFGVEMGLEVASFLSQISLFLVVC